MKKFLFILCVYLLAVAPSYAKSVIHLKGGDKIDGDIIERTDDYVKVNFEGIELTYWNDQIERVEESVGNRSAASLSALGNVSEETTVLPSQIPSLEPKPITETSENMVVQESIVTKMSEEKGGQQEVEQDQTILVDGSNQDWAQALFVFDEVGESLSDDSDRFDVKKLYLAADNTYLYFLVTLNQDVSDFFAKNEEATSSFIAEIYFNTDNNVETGCDDVKLFRYGMIKGYDHEITLSAGLKEMEGSVKPFVSYGILIPTEQRNSFYMQDAGYLSSSSDKDSMIRFSGNVIEFAIPLSLLNIQKGLSVEGLMIECAKMSGNRFVFIVKKEKGLSVFDSVKVLESEYAKKQEVQEAQPAENIQGAVSQGTVLNQTLKDESEYWKSKGSRYGEAVKFMNISGALVPMFIFYIFFSLCLQVIAIKTKTPLSWHAWIPIGNFILMCRIATKPLWWAILLFIPLVNIVFIVLLWMAIAEARDKPGWLGIGMVLPGLNLIVLLYLAFFK